MSTVLAAAVIFTFAKTQVEGAKILAVFPTPSISHQVVFRPLTQELANQGHDVVVITTDPAFKTRELPPNLREIDVHDISYRIWAELYKITSKGDGDMISFIKPVFDAIIEIFEMQLQVPEVQKLINEEKFDLLFLEACAKPALVLSHIFNAPVIQISSLGFLEFNVNTIGASWHPILYPNTFSRRIYNLTTWERAVALWNYYKIETIMNSVEEAENAMIEKVFGGDFPTIMELKDNVDMMFVNIHPLWADNRSVPPNTLYIWGIHKRPVKELPKDIKEYLDSSDNGVIYMSLGTNVQPSLLPPDKVQMLVKVFSKLPYDVLWKWDKDELPGRTENIRISKWLPQSDLLRHPKIKLFITQGGLQSTDEAITAGVPLIGIPMLGDQWYNVEKYVYHKIGIKLDMESLQEEKFMDAIKTVIDDQSYRQNIKRLRDIMSDEPIEPLDRAVWWTEYVLRHRGAKHLRSPAANISWMQYLEFELALTILIACVVALIGIFILLLSIVHFSRKFIGKTSKNKIS